MLNSAARKSASLAESREDNTSLVRTKIWLPKLIYNALPWFYVGAGIAAFVATLYINHWFWVLPHYVLFSVACVHLGLLVYRRRRGRGSDDA